MCPCKRRALKPRRAKCRSLDTGPSMSELQQETWSLNTKEASTCAQDRRGAPRSQNGGLVYLRSIPPRDEQFEEIRTLNNRSDSGFYFVTDRMSYIPGTQLHVIPAVSSLNLEFVGEVVRVQSLPAGDYGVAVKVLRVSDVAVDSRTAVRSVFGSLSRLLAEPCNTNEETRI